MSEANTLTPPCDPAIEIIDEQVRGLEADIAANTRRVEQDTAVRDRLLTIRGTLVRKLRPRKVRAVTEAPANDTPANDTTGDVFTRPTLFAPPSAEAA